MESIVLEPGILIKNQNNSALSLRSKGKCNKSSRRRLRLRRVLIHDLFRSDTTGKAKSRYNYSTGESACNLLYNPICIEMDKATQLQFLRQQYHLVNSEFACILYERNELKERVAELEEENRHLKAVLLAL